MRRIRLTTVGCVVLVSSVLASSWCLPASDEVSPRDPRWPPAKYKLGELSITLERTECFGTCPVYSVTIRGDGAVIYRGDKCVAVAGKERYQVSRDKVLELLNEFYARRFFDLKETYFIGNTTRVLEDSNVQELLVLTSDVPSAVLTFKVTGYVKRVAWCCQAPADLDALAQEVDSVGGTLPWVKGQ
jgi:hypothetical protein